MRVMALALVWALTPAMATAHENHAPRTDTVEIGRSGARVVVEHSIPAAKADDLRKIYDRDRDGSLDASERALLESWLRIVATKGLVLEIDGERVALAEESARFEIGARGDLHARLVLAARAPLAPGPHTVALRDRGSTVVVLRFGEGLAPAPGAASRAILTRTQPVLAVAFQAF